MEEAEDRRKWTLLTSHGHVLVEIARNPRARVRDISAIIGITERATQAIIADLERAGYVQRVRVGRRTHYLVHMDNPFRHSAQDGLQVGPFLEMLAGPTALEDAVAAEGAVAESLVMDPIGVVPDPLAAAGAGVLAGTAAGTGAAIAEPTAIPSATLAAPEIPEFPGFPGGGEYPKN